MQITREFGFDAAHRILGHGGRCGWLHGHGYRMAVTVESALDERAMVMDFADLKALVADAVLDAWDHSTLLRRDDPLVPPIAAVQAAAPERLVLFPVNPTAEALTRAAFAAIAKRLPERVRLVSVTIRETPSCSSTYDGADE